MRKTSYCLVLVVLSVLNSAIGFAQATASGTIQGTVFDQSQAVIAAADVVITSKATGERRTSATNGVGTYRFDLLSAGTYTVKVSKVGFASIVENVDLLVGATATANATLRAMM